MSALGGVKADLNGRDEGATRSFEFGFPTFVSRLQTVVCSLNSSGVPVSQCAIAYYRVSTQRQGRSGFGLEAQRAALARFAEAEGITILQEVTEVETGKRADALDRRPQLSAALASRKSQGRQLGSPTGAAS